LEIRDNKDVRDALKAARTCLAYEKYLEEEKKKKGETLLEMSDCLSALSAALANVDASVACNKMGRCAEPGVEPEFAGADAWQDASVVDLRQARLGVVAMEALQSPYAKAPPPVFAKGPAHLSNKQMAALGELLVSCEAGMPPRRMRRSCSTSPRRIR
jgi:hypothetical protein